MHRIFIAIALVCFVAATATAQTKFSSTAQCGQPDAQHEIPVGDLPDYSMAVLQVKCTDSKPMEIAGAKSVSTVITIANEVSGDTARARGCQVATMDSGDKVFVSHEGTRTSEGQDGTWTFTGKLKGIKGKGTYRCSSSGCDITGVAHTPLLEPKLNDSGSLYYIAFPNFIDVVDFRQGMLRIRFSLSETLSNTATPMGLIRVAGTCI